MHSKTLFFCIDCYIAKQYRDCTVDCKYIFWSHKAVGDVSMVTNGYYKDSSLQIILHIRRSDYIARQRRNCILDCVKWVNVTNLLVILTTLVVIHAVKQ